MPTIEIPDQTFKRLQSIAAPFVDTPATVITRLLDAFDQARLDQNRDKGVTRATLAEPPNLTDTRVISATFGADLFGQTNWNDLVRKVHELAFRRVGSFDALAKLTTANVQNRITEEKGYKPIPNLGFSVQGVDANEAWRIVYHLARKMNVSLEVECEWRITERAERPGEAFRLVWTPS